MQKIVIASQNPVKIRAVLNGFQRMFPGESFLAEHILAASEVNDQPLSSVETLKGAENRAQKAVDMAPGADYWVGIEGGVEEDASGIAAFCWVVVRGKPSGSQVGKSRSGSFYLPRPVADLIRRGLELGDADDLIFSRSNSKQENGAIGLLTNNIIDRTALYEHAVILALVPFKNPGLY